VCLIRPDDAGRYFFPNGSALMLYRGGPCGISYKNGTKAWCDKHQIGIATAPSWNGTFTRRSLSPVFSNQTEDPGLFRDARGNFHMLGHWFHNGMGGHAFSKDGLEWTFAGAAYGSELKW
jgi:hypothetical protein